MSILTSEGLKAKDTDMENYHYQLDDGAQYALTEGEKGWLSFVCGKYAIYDHINECSVLDDAGRLVYTLDIEGMSKALDDDCGGWGKATCLADDTALQAIFFYNYREQD